MRGRGKRYKMGKEEDVRSEIFYNIIENCRKKNLEHIDEKYLQDYKNIQKLLNHKINDEIDDEIEKLVDIIYKDIKEEENSL
jgi:hypothetical protein